jgi:hypothetical protein
VSPVSKEDIVREVREAIVSATKLRSVETGWIQQQIVSAHVVAGDIGSDWSLQAAHIAIRAIVREALRSLSAVSDLDEETSAQPFLPKVDGYKHLQPIYLLARSGKSMCVPLWDVSDAELMVKASQLRKNGLGCFAHAEEIERFLAKRDLAQPRA